MSFPPFSVHAVDSFAARQLVKLEEKVPAIKSQPDEVVTYLSESKEAISTKITDSHTALTGRINDGKDALSAHISSGKEAISSRVSAGKDAIVSKVQSGAAVVANTRAGALVGSGVDHTICATEGIVDYLIPAEENEKELLSESGKTKEEIEMAPLGATSPEASTAASEAEEEVVVTEEVEKEEKEVTTGRVDRIKTISRKVKLRIYYRSMRRLHTVQQQSKSTLEQLKATIDLVRHV